MPASRAARLILRVAGWLLTPLILIAAAAIGASIGLLVALLLPVNVGVGVTVGGALVAAIVALILWARLLRARPALRRALDVTPEGAPDTRLIDALIHPDKT